MKIIIFFLLFSFSAFSQYSDEQLEKLLNSTSEKKLMRVNTSLLLSGFYYQGSQISKRLLELDPENANYNYRMGFSLIHISLDNSNASFYLEKAKRNISKKHNMSSIKEDSAPIDALFFLAKSYHADLELDKAIENYYEFLKIASKKKR